MKNSTIEQFEDAYPLIFSYPWPDSLNSHIERMKVDMDGWIDTDFPFLKPETREKYRRMNLSYCTARMVPIAPSYAHVSACNHFMIWECIVDDYFGLCSVEEIEKFRKNFIVILNGGEPSLNAHDLEKSLAVIRDEYLAVMSAEWMKIFINFINGYFEYGLKAESPFKTTETFPNLLHYKIIREYCIGLYMNEPWAQLGLGIVLPEVILENPIILRLQALTARICGWHNDVYSAKKESKRIGETMNLVLIIRHEQKVSLEEALKQAVEIHDNDVAEFEVLRNDLPDFGEWTNKVQDYILYLGRMIAGLNRWYVQDTRRYYTTDQFAEKEYVREK